MPGQLGYPRGHHFRGSRFVIYTIRGITRVADNANDATCDILDDLASGDPTFFPALAERVRGRTRRLLARSPEEVYPERPDLSGYVRRIGDWYIATNIANREKDRILREACRLARLTYGRDLIVHLPHA